MDNVLTCVGVVTFSYVIWRLIVNTRRFKTVRPSVFVLPPDVTLKPQSLLSEKELIFYNLIRLAVQDHYLVLARVPLSSIFHLEAERKARLHVLRHSALKQLDFVLVHPGSRMVEQVIELDEGSPCDEFERREVEILVQAAGIKMTILMADARYAVRQLAEILGVSVPD
jgi:hypothetical protein